jgi:hypothetical protein
MIRAVKHGELGVEVRWQRIEIFSRARGFCKRVVFTVNDKYGDANVA